ncbi:MAG: alpha/beta fold hydrolase [Acidimicrobiales bacterium]
MDRDAGVPGDPGAEPTVTVPADVDDDYDELSFLEENAAEAGLEWRGRPRVMRDDVTVASGRVVSALVWGDASASLVLLHGGGQNAHTWDTVALALGEPLVAIDLPGHGHSSQPAGPDGLDLVRLADDVAVAVRRWAPQARAVVGMSLGGLVALALAARQPDLVRHLVLVDITPGVDRRKSASVAAFLAGPESFGSLEEMVERTIAFNPSRSESSLRRGVRHNAVRRSDGRWTWRHQLGRPDGGGTQDLADVDFSGGWDDLGRVAAPVTLVRGGCSPMVDDADITELLRRRPDTRVEVVEGAGHSVQGDRPLELAALLRGVLDGN